jgi:hypothetical protein
VRSTVGRRTMNRTWCPRLAVPLALAAMLVSSGPSLAGELFPYQPPSSSSGAPSTRQSPPRPRTGNAPSVDARSAEMEQRFPESVRSLNTTERRQLRLFLVSKIEEAEREGDVRRADYYRGLLRRTELER